MQKTTNYGLNKPDVTDFYDVADQNGNMDIIDEKLKELEENSLTDADLAGYYKSSGGMITGEFTVRRISNGYSFLNKNHSDTVDYGTVLKDVANSGKENLIELCASQNTLRYRDVLGNITTILNSGNVGSYALPLSGGAIKGDLELVSSDATVKIFRLSNSKRTINFVIYADGRFCIEDPKNNVTMFSSDADGKTSVKPITGTYTGNGSATQRYIYTGGIGDSILIQGNGYEIIVTKGVGIGGNKTTYKGFGDGEVYFSNGTCELNTSHEALNANGVVYTYQVL